jgi:hypothetical protein
LAAKRFTLRSAIRTPEQKPYLAARFTLIERSSTRRSGGTFWARLRRGDG